MRRQLKIIIVIATVLLLTCLSVAPVFAQPAVCRFAGTATLDGVAGSSVTAELAADGTVVGGPVTVNAADSSYYMLIPQVGGVPAEGAALNFYVDGFLGGSSTWNAGGIKTLDLVAVSGPTYTLTVNINPTGGGTVTDTGIACPGDCTQDYAGGTVVTLTAAANTGYEFVNWTGNASGTSLTVDVTMNADKTVTANFRIPGEYVLKPGPNTLSTPAYLDSTLGVIIPATYGTEWLGYKLSSSGNWQLATASTTINPLDGFVIINLTTSDIDLDVDNWPWAEWEEGDQPLLPPTKVLQKNRWALVGPAPGLVDGVALDVSVDDFLVGVTASRIVSPGWGDQAAWSAYFLQSWGDFTVNPYKAYFVFVTATSQLVGSCTLP